MGRKHTHTQRFQAKSKTVSTVARYRFFISSKTLRYFCSKGVGRWLMASTKVLYYSHRQALSFEHAQHIQLVERRELRDLTSSVKARSLKKNRSLFHQNTVSTLCLCVCFLPIHSGHQVRWTYPPGSHRRKVTKDFSSTFLLRCVP